jgi:hypothetical protein
MSDCVWQSLLQTGKSQIPAERVTGPRQIEVKSLIPTHEGTGCPEVRKGGSVDPEGSSSTLLLGPHTSGFGHTLGLW